MSRNNMSVGLLLIVIAVVLLLGKLGVFGFIGGLLWPLLVIAAGAGLHMLYFNRTVPAAALIPGGMLVIYGLMFMFCNVFGWGAMSFLWPGFILGIAVGLYEMYFFDRRERTALTVSIVLAVLAGVLFTFTVIAKLGVYFIAAVLLIAGLLLIWRRPRVW
ncbi:hypothetical protein ACFFK0_28380 [Paenibacillus chartarius]|uniref:DUF5668 domain-containing protein n=1 Tax=Paenibacillus chartarius TaxID=747481 RepID=A0ABV6DUM6_9BACL